MSHDELTVVVEHDDVLITLEDLPTNDVNIMLAGNIGPPGPIGPVGPEGPEGPPVEGLDDHIASELPHPVYDDGPSLAILYENAKV